MTARQLRHTNRAAAPRNAAVEVLACRCPIRELDGVLWAYTRQLGWHDPGHHAAETDRLQQHRHPRRR